LVRLIDKARVFGNELEAKLRHRLAKLQKPVELRRSDTFMDMIGDVAAREARTADVFVAMRPNGAAQEPEQRVENVLFGAGRHLFLVPERMAAPPAFDHVMIAWNGGREAARAVAEALPCLRKAETVSIVDEDEDEDEDEPVEEQVTIGKNLVEHLLHHGVGAAVHRVMKDGSIGSMLVAESNRVKPDLIVMGGYGHSKLREWLLGGASYEMLHNAAGATPDRALNARSGGRASFRSIQVLLDPSAERPGVGGSGALRDDLVLPEHDQHGNAADIVARREFPLGFGVNLEKSDFGLKLRGNALERRSHDLARPAPIGPEVNNHRDVTVLDLRREALGGRRKRFPAEQRLVTTAAIGSGRRLVGGNAVDGIAMRANDIACLSAHGSRSCAETRSQLR
jgi:nucleotide-binding universal stress UspA family protein